MGREQLNCPTGHVWKRGVGLKEGDSICPVCKWHEPKPKEVAKNE